MFKRIAIFLVLLIVGILGFAATKPDTFRVQRSTSIKAPPDKVFALVNNFHSWDGWSPWEKMDLTMKKTYGGPDSGPGATYEWDGNDKVGKGKMEISKVAEPKEINLKLHFMKPFECQNRVDFTFENKGEATDVTWAMHGPSPYFSKLIQVFMSMDSMVGKDFEAGLANLKAIAEKN